MKHENLPLSFKKNNAQKLQDDDQIYETHTHG